MKNCFREKKTTHIYGWPLSNFYFEPPDNICRDITGQESFHQKTKTLHEHNSNESASDPENRKPLSHGNDTAEPIRTERRQKHLNFHVPHNAIP